MSQGRRHLRLRLRVPLLLGALPTITLPLACDQPFVGSGCGDVCPLSTRVEGQVIDPSGVPVPDVEVRLRPLFLGLGDDPCVHSPAYEEEELAVFVRTGDRGEFSAVLEAPSIDVPDCVEIRADPPPRASLLPRTDTIRASWVPPARSIPGARATLILFPG